MTNISFAVCMACCMIREVCMKCEKLHTKNRYGKLTFVTWYLDAIYTVIAYDLPCSNVETVTLSRACKSLTLECGKYYNETSCSFPYLFLVGTIKRHNGRRTTLYAHSVVDVKRRAIAFQFGFVWTWSGWDYSTIFILLCEFIAIIHTAACFEIRWNEHIHPTVFQWDIN